MIINDGSGDSSTEGYNEKTEARETFGDSWDTSEDLEDPASSEQDLRDNTVSYPTSEEAFDGLTNDTAPTPADNEEEQYRAKSYLDGLETDLEGVNKELDEYKPGTLTKIASTIDRVATGGLIGSALDAFNKLTQSGEDALNDAEKNALKAGLEVEKVKLENRIKATKDGLKEVENRISEQEKDAISKKVDGTLKAFVREQGREPNQDEVRNITKEAVILEAPNSQAAADIRKASQEALIKSYNPNANISQFGMVDPKMLGGDSNTALESGLGQLSQLEAKRAEAQSIKDKALTGMDSWTTLNDSNRDAWAKYYNPESYNASATNSDYSKIGPASQATGDYKSDLSTLKNTNTGVNLTNTDAWKDYFKGVDGYNTVASEAVKTTVAPSSQLQGDYQASGEALNNFDPSIMSSEQRADAVNAMNMSRDRATGKAPSVADIDYMSNLDKLIGSQQGAAAAQRGSSNPLAMRSVAQQASQMGQQAVRETASLRAKEQQDAELAYANQANQLMLADQQKAMQEKQMQLEQKVQQTQVELQNAKNTLDKDIFNIDAMNKVNQLQATLDSSLQEFNASSKNQVALQNTQNKVAMTQYAGGQEQAQMIYQLQADSTSKANELQKNIQYTQGLLDNAKIEFSKDQFNADSANKVKTLQAQLDTQTANLNAELQTRTALANAQSNLQGSMWAGAQAQGALGTQLAQERTDTMSKYGVGRDALGTEMDILNTLANQEIGLGSAQKGWDYNQQQADRQADMDYWAKLGTTVQAVGGLAGTAKTITDMFS